MRAFGQSVLLARTKRRMSQDALARAVGKSHGWVSLLERGLIEKPYPEDLRRVVETLGMPEKELTRLVASLSSEGVAPAGPGGRRITLSEEALEELLQRAAAQGAAQALREWQERHPQED